MRTTPLTLPHERILVGEDARRIDDLVRQSPERAYDVGKYREFPELCSKHT